jgi:hypothetical protein
MSPGFIRRGDCFAQGSYLKVIESIRPQCNPAREFAQINHEND